MNAFEIVGKIVIDGMQEAQTQMSKLEGFAKKNATALKEVGAAAATLGAAMTAVAGYMAKTAIESDATRKSFEYLAESHGQSAEEILSALQNASAGTVSANDLMLSANRAMTLGVADNTETFTALMEIARDRAQVMGITTTQAFDNIVTGIGRGSPLILDNLGLIVNVTAANEDYAKQLGKTASELTGAEQNQALLNAVLVQGQSTINKSAQATMTASEKTQALKASISDTASTIGTFLLPAVTTITGWITNVITKVKEWTEENEGLAKAITIAGSVLGVLLTGIGGGILLFVKMVTTISSFVNIVKTLEITTKLATAAQWLWNVALSANPIGLVVTAVAALIAGIVALTLAIKNSKNEYQKFADNVRKNSDQMKQDVKTYYTEWINNAREASNAAIAALNAELSAARSAYNEKIAMLNAERAAKLQTVDDNTNATITELQAQIQAIQDEVEAKRLADLIASENEQIAYLESQIAAATDAETKKKLQEDLANYIAQVNQRRWEQAKADQQAALQEQIEAARAAAESEKEIINDTYDAAAKAEADKLAAAQEAINAQIAAEESALAAKVALYDADVAAFSAMNAAKLSDVAAFVEEYNRIMASLGQTEEQITIPDVSGSTTPAVPGGDTHSIIGMEIPGYASGGPIDEPTLLYGLKSKRAYAVAGESGTEDVVPRGKAYKSATIILQLDGQTIAEVVNQPLLDNIRLIAGAKI